MKKKGKIGSSFDDFLKQDGIYEQVTARAIKRVIARQLGVLMQDQGLRTTVENKQFFSRRIDGAFLLVGPANEEPEDTARRIFNSRGLKYDFLSSNEMVRVVSNRMKQDVSRLVEGSTRMLIPLPYYTWENVDVGDEKLQYEHIIQHHELLKGIYAVRFYIEAIPRLHRIVHASFRLGDSA